MDPIRLEKLQLIQDWELNKPPTDSDWAEDIKAENLDVKFDYQLQEMLEIHTEKVLKVEKDLDVFTNWPQVKRYELTQQFEQMFKSDEVKDGKLEGKTLQEWIDEEFESQQLYYTWKVAKLNQSNLRIAKEIELRAKGYLEVKEEKLFGTLPVGSKIRIPLGTTYYIDPTNGTDTFAGTRIDSTIDSTATTSTFVDDALTGAADYINGSFFYNVTTGAGTLISDFDDITDTVTLTDADASMAAGDTYFILNAWLDLDTFTEAARSAGDKVIIRRGAVQCDDGTDLNFTSDGTIANPIIIEADFDNLWRDQVDLSATATATLTFGSKTVTYASDISGVLAAGDWIYASGDSNKEFAYEVASVSTVTATLYLPYKGNQAGSGRTTYNMQDNPIWNTAAGDFQWNFDTDDYWKVQGLHIRGTDANGNVEIDSSYGHIFLDCIFTGSSLDHGFKLLDDHAIVILGKCRWFDHQVGFYGNSADVYGFINLSNCYFDDNNESASTAISIGGGATSGMIDLYVTDTEIINYTTAIVSPNSGARMYTRNIKFNGVTPIGSKSTAVSLLNVVSVEDYDNTIGDNRYFGYGSGSNIDAVLYQSETTTVRSGGSNKSIKVTPTTNMTTIWDFNKLMVFELPIYATTDSKTYTVYFRPNTTAEWTTDPTTSELWIELEAWGHATNNFRKITKSTEVIDMNGSTDWQALTVTVAPAQAGVAYLRCWYAKTKEAGANVFFVDPIPVIS